jgi:putative addiction module component (TIGR02574 family)
MSVDEIFREAHLLSVEDRLRLADSLLDSIDPPDPEVERAWMEVIRRRDEDLETGRVQAIPGDEFMAELKRRYPGA